MPPTDPITRDDIQAKFSELRGQVDDKAETARDVALTAAVVGLVVVAGVAFLLGRRRGKADKTVVEIRRV